MKLPGVISLCLATVSVISIGGCGVALVKEYPTKQKLADCKSDFVEVRYTCPTGDYFSLVLGVPTVQADSLNLTGQVTIESTGGAVPDLRSYKFQELKSCNWLSNDAGGPQLAGYILLWSKVATNHFGSFMEAGKVYDIKVAFDKSPPEDSSLWMHWLVRK